MHEPDPRNLIGEAYRMPHLSEADCRVVFLDWAIGVPAEDDAAEAIRALLARHAGQEAHPMTEVLRAALAPVASKGRRGGRSGRRV
ncbi:hypothetical protein [Roseitranquillus sediminis]|uniref:hypothetical protein n=1 Tax=Roseitranquillus sediminis TaxID=2809051 RepID=UPI001D0BF4DB|nr:hypothetical protein [Roseitranquillus sediminis]MBM9594146.1 hypothetical protein [Roseitranquillus sediminis]